MSGLPWFKVESDLFEDENISFLTPYQFYILMKLCAYSARRSPITGMTVQQLCLHLGLKRARNGIESLLKRDLLGTDSESNVIVTYFINTNSSKQISRERVAKHRKNKQLIKDSSLSNDENVTLQKRYSNALDIELDIDKDLDKDIDLSKDIDLTYDNSYCQVDSKKTTLKKVTNNVIALKKHTAISTSAISETALEESFSHDIDRIFEFWKSTMQHERARLDDKRKRLIRHALKQGYAVEDLCEAISGCAKTPHNMGFNDNKQRYDGLHIILRDADQIERFIENNKKPFLNPTGVHHGYNSRNRGNTGLDALNEVLDEGKLWEL